MTFTSLSPLASMGKTDTDGARWEMKVCKDCKHCEHGSKYSMCGHPEARRDRVNGYAFCDFERTYGYPCGLDGSLFEQKPVGTLFEQKPITWLKRIFGGAK